MNKQKRITNPRTIDRKKIKTNRQRQTKEQTVKGSHIYERTKRQEADRHTSTDRQTSN